MSPSHFRPRGVMAATALVALIGPAAHAQRSEIESHAKSDWLAYHDGAWRCLAVGNYKLAETRFLTAIEKIRPFSDRDPRSLARSYNDLALTLHFEGRDAEAEPLAKWALSVREARCGAKSRQVAFSLYTLAMVEIGQKKYSEAEPHLARAIDIREAIYGHYSGQLTIWLDDLAALLCLEGKYADAEPVYRRLLALPRSELPEESPIRVECLRGLAEIYVQKKEDLRAEIFDRRALAMLEKGSALSPELVETLQHLAQILHRTGRDDQAQALEDRIRSLTEQRQ